MGGPVILRALDTNVLLRYLTADDPHQSPRARALIDDSPTGDTQLLITLPVLCELGWLLRSRRYGFSREQISQALERLLASGRFRFQARSEVILAVEAFRRGRADLSDYLIRALSRDEGASDVVTFDQEFAQEDGVTLLGPLPGQ